MQKSDPNHNTHVLAIQIQVTIMKHCQEQSGTVEEKKYFPFLWVFPQIYFGWVFYVVIYLLICWFKILFIFLLLNIFALFESCTRLTTYSKRGRSHVGSQVLLEGSTRSKLIAWRNYPESHCRINADPSMNLVIFVVTWILVLVIHLGIKWSTSLSQKLAHALCTKTKVHGNTYPKQSHPIWPKAQNKVVKK